MICFVGCETCKQKCERELRECRAKADNDYKYDKRDCYRIVFNGEKYTVCMGSANFRRLTALATCDRRYASCLRKCSE